LLWTLDEAVFILDERTHRYPLKVGGPKFGLRTSEKRKNLASAVNHSVVIKFN